MLTSPGRRIPERRQRVPCPQRDPTSQGTLSDTRLARGPPSGLSFFHRSIFSSTASRTKSPSRLK